jgi:hypothetical protein
MLNIITAIMILRRLGFGRAQSVLQHTETGDLALDATTNSGLTQPPPTTLSGNPMTVTPAVGLVGKPS